MNRILSSAAIALLVVFGGCEASEEAEEEEVSEPEPVEPTEVAPGDPTEVEALRAQVADLQAQLARRESEPPPSGTQTAVIPEEVGSPGAQQTDQAPTAPARSGSTEPATTGERSANRRTSTRRSDDRDATENPVRLLGSLIEQGQRQIQPRNGEGEADDEEETLPLPLFD